jgi:hypothetical protein
MQPVTLSIPEALYEKLLQRAEQTQRTVADELLDLVVASLPAEDDLDADLTRSVSQLATLGDAALLQAARATMPADAAEELERLHLKRQREGLAEDEAAAAAALTRQYERVMLLRAEAAALLAERGHDLAGIRGAA